MKKNIQKKKMKGPYQLHIYNYTNSVFLLTKKKNIKEKKKGECGWEGEEFESKLDKVVTKNG